MEKDLCERIRQAILVERKKKTPHVLLGTPYLLYHVKKIPVYCTNVTCLVHIDPCHWMDAAYLLGDQIYVVLFEDLTKSGFVLGEYVQFCVLRKQYQEGKHHG